MTKEFVLKGVNTGGNLHIDYKAELNDEQLPVVEHGDGRVLVLAGAGSGKTRTITYRVAWLLEHGITPSSILLLTFTNKASREMISRVEGLLGYYPNGLWAGTFHSIANRLLRRYAIEIGFAPNFSILDQEDARELIGLIVKEKKIKPIGVRFPSSSVLHSIFSFQANKKCTMKEALEKKHPKFLHFSEEITAVGAAYREQKRQQNAMDFDDLLNKLLELLQTNGMVRDALATQFQYVLVDEFQDTNVIQAEIVNLLTSVHNNLLVVGDDAQSIYSFRAADIQNILGFPQRYDETKTYRLTKNYRSTPQILKLANQSISYNEEQFEKSLVPIVEDGEKPALVPAQNASQQAQYIAEQILEIHESGENFSEIAVLFRAAYHSQALEFELMKRDIPYEYRGGMKFFERSHIKDAIAHLRIIHNIRDAMAWIRVMKIHPGVGLVTANKIAQQATVLETFDDVPSIVVSGKKATQGWQHFMRIYDELKKGKGRAADYIRLLVASDEYALYLENEFPNYHERKEDLEQFALFAEQYDDMGAFLEAVSLTDEFGAVHGEDDTRDQDRIVLSTIHQSKGLEWDSVFIMHLADGLFPVEKVINEEGIEEERRLFYVAVTRARKRLFLTYPITVGFDRVELKQPSQFIEEIPPSLMEEVQLRHAQPRSSYSSGYSSKRESSFYDDEPAIVLDDLGEERERKPFPSSFLSDIDDL